MDPRLCSELFQAVSLRPYFEKTSLTRLEPRHVYPLIGAENRTLECLLNMIDDLTPLSNDASDVLVRENKFEEMRFVSWNYLWDKNRGQGNHHTVFEGFLMTPSV